LRHRDTLEGVIGRWVADADSSVEYAEEVDGRWAVRMRQEARDVTTVWFEIGERSIRAETYVIPLPPAAAEEVYRQCLVRNTGGWRCHFALDREGAVVIVGRLAAEHVDALELDLLLGEIHQLIEVSFRPLVRAAFSREKPL
jgi:hypothetical protein